MRAKQVESPIAIPSPPLIQDIIDIILELLYSQNYAKPRENRRALSQYSLISKAWRRPAQRLLYQEVSIRSPQHLERLKGAVNNKTQQGLFLGGCVRVLKLTVDESHVLTCIAPADVAPMMRLFPRLFLLHLETYRGARFSPSVIQALESTPPIQALMISTPDMVFGTALRTNKTKLHYQLLNIRKWPLRHFAMVGNFEVESPPLSLPPPRHQFMEVQLWAVGVARGSLVNWIMKNSMETIQILSVPFPFNSIKKVSYRLRSLECELRDHYGGPASLPLSEIEELLWIRIHWIQVSTARPNLIPPSVIHLGIDLQQTRYTFSRWKELSTILPKRLRRISIVGYSQILFTMELDRQAIEQALGGRVRVWIYNSIGDYNKKNVSLSKP
jgi:hypothetical protein